MIRDPWHFERGEFTERIITLLAEGPAQALAHGAERPFGQEFRRALGVALREDVPSPGRVQAALRRLERLGLADNQAGVWTLTDPEFAAWIRDNHEPES